jgi:chaperonin GroEL
MPKFIVHGNEARIAIRDGVNHLANAVKVTLGPRGRNVVIEKRFGPPILTKDGVTVAREIELPDPIQNIGAQMLREVALKMSDVAGDGTTTATVLAQSIYNAGMKVLDRGTVNPMALKRGIDKAVAVVVGNRVRRDPLSSAIVYEGGSLNELSTAVTDDMVEKIGTISANGDEQIGRMIADAMKRVGEDGVITVEESPTMDSELTVVEGMQFERGYISPYFATNAARMEASLKEPYIYITNRTLSTVADIKPIMSLVAPKGELFIIAADINGVAAQMLVENHVVHRSIRACAIKAPGFGPQQSDALRDIAILTGGHFFDETLGAKDNTVSLQYLEKLGRAEKILVTADSTTIIVSSATRPAVEARISEIRAGIQAAKSDVERRKLQERLAKLTGGIGVIRVGAPTELEMKEKKDRVEDATHATRAAVQEGIVPGGGVALLRCCAAVEVHMGSWARDELEGAQLVLDAMQCPLRQIVENAGEDENEILEKVLAGTGSYGYNAATSEYEDLVAVGVIDPTKVTRHALINAASIAGMMLTTEALISEIPVEPGQQAMPAGMQGMM